MNEEAYNAIVTNFTNKLKAVGDTQTLRTNIIFDVLQKSMPLEILKLKNRYPNAFDAHTLSVKEITLILESTRKMILSGELNTDDGSSVFTNHFTNIGRILRTQQEREYLIYDLICGTLPGEELQKLKSKYDPVDNANMITTDDIKMISDAEAWKLCNRITTEKDNLCKVTDPGLNAKIARAQIKARRLRRDV